MQQCNAYGLAAPLGYTDWWSTSLPLGLLTPTNFWFLNEGDIRIQMTTTPCGGFTPRACISAVSATQFGELFTFVFHWDSQTISTYFQGQPVTSLPMVAPSGGYVEQIDGKTVLSYPGLFTLELTPGTADTEAIEMTFFEQGVPASGLCALQTAAVTDVVLTPASLLPTANCNGACVAPQQCFLNPAGASQCYGTTALPVKVTASGFRHDSTTGGFTGTVQLTNTTSQAISGPVEVVFTHLPGAVTLLNATGVFQGNPYITVPPLSSPTAVLGPNQSVIFQATFSAMAGAILAQPVVYSGPLQ
jgi:hypothetical protein